MTYCLVHLAEIAQSMQLMANVACAHVIALAARSASPNFLMVVATGSYAGKVVALGTSWAASVWLPAATTRGGRGRTLFCLWRVWFQMADVSKGESFLKLNLASGHLSVHDEHSKRG